MLNPHGFNGFSLLLFLLIAYHIISKSLFIMKRIYTLLLTALIPLLMLGGTQGQSNPITPDLIHEMTDAGATEYLRINIRLAQQYDAEAFNNIRQSMTRQQRRTYVVNELKSFAAQTQQSVLTELETLQIAGEVNQVNALWIANVITCYATPSAIGQLAQHADIARIDIDEERILIDPVEFADATEDQLREITYNVAIMNVPQVWDMGFTGQDVVVAVLDTGVNYNHSDLQNNMWEHPDFPYHGWNFTSNSNNPMDFHGHGTHCAGTVAGDGTAGSQTGMAPSAKIMALQVLTASGGGTESGVWAAIEFGVEYGADVLSLSLGWQHSWGPDRAAWRTTMDNALAAGVVAAVAAGNEGDQQSAYPIPSNVRTPGDIPAPWRHPDQPDTGTRSAVVCVGATNQSDNIASFSSRGPVTWQNVNPYNDYQYSPGAGLIRPDVVAPGVDVKSLRHNNNSGYTTMSGTSMATPGVAGVMALILSKNPGISPEEMSQLLEETALSFSPFKSNTFGSGRVDALEAILNTSFPGPVYVSHAINDEQGNNNGQVNPTELISLDLALVNNSDQVFEGVEAYVYTESPYITFIDSIAFFGNFDQGQTVEVADAVSFQVANNIPGSYRIVFTIETTDGSEIWKSSFEIVAGAPRLLMTSFTIDDSEGNGNGILDAGEEAIVQLKLSNMGQMTIDESVVHLSTSSPFITINNSEQSITNISPIGFALVDFSVTVSPAAPIGQPFQLTVDAYYGVYHLTQTIKLRFSPLVEDFETGDFSMFEWEFGGNQPWTMAGFGSFEGVYSSRSGSINNNQSSSMQVEMEVATEDTIRFMARVSSEAEYDFLRFYIDNAVVGEWSGEMQWTELAFPVNPGLRTFRWLYIKDGFVSEGSDAAWVDYIVFPQPLTTIAYAGQDAIVCAGLDFGTDPIVANANEITWESDGDGTFENPHTANTFYTPGEIDIETGGVTLILTVLGIDEVTKTDSMLLSISPPVEASAGENRTICMGSVLHIASATAENYASLYWMSSGTGNFDEMHQLETTYTPSEADYEAGMVTITLVAEGHGNCEDVHAPLELSFSPEPEVLLAENIEACSNMAVELAGMATNYSALLWASTGTGSFDDQTAMVTSYLPSEDDLAAGHVTLSLTVAGNEGCSDVTADMLLSFMELPDVSVSGTMEFCTGESAEITLHLTGNGPWTIDMGEAFDDIIAETPEYILYLNPETTTTYSMLSLSDANGCVVEEALEFTLTHLEMPQTPSQPYGPDVVDYVETTQSAFSVSDVAFADNYEWKLEPANAGALIQNGTELTVNWNTEYVGNANLSIKAMGFCGESNYSDVLVINLKNTTGIDELNGLGQVFLYPNPSDGLLNLEFSSREPQQLILTVTNQLGQVVFSGIKDVGSGKTNSTIDLTKLRSGHYQLSLQNENGLVIRKLMINR
jgi:subtilisin family serine protease